MVLSAISFVFIEPAVIEHELTLTLKVDVTKSAEVETLQATLKFLPVSIGA
jgi:hypothetical protein